MTEEPQHVRGLPAIEEARTRRAEGRLPAIPTRFLLWTATAIVAWAIFYWRRSQAEVESQKARLFARQRAVLSELGPRVDPLRDRIEGWVMAAAAPYQGDVVAPEAKTWDFAGVPGIYMRLRQSDAVRVAEIRKAAQRSLRDGFTACLFHEPNADPTSGPPCRVSSDCPAGTFCNEVDHCTPAAQPYNMRAAYRGVRVLGDEWTVGLRSASDDMQMRLLEREFESAVKDDIPLVIDLLTRAQFFLLLLDEDAAAGVSARLEDLQAMPHPARVFLFGLKGGKERLVLRLRREVDAHFVPAGETASTDPAVLAAQQRQVMSCELALDVRAAVAQ
jgi:hypothetical protein